MVIIKHKTSRLVCSAFYAVCVGNSKCESKVSHWIE